MRRPLGFHGDGRRGPAMSAAWGLAAVLPAALAAGMLAAAGLAWGGPEDAGEAWVLVAGEPAVRELAGGESHRYRLALEAGDAVEVSLDQRGIDVGLILRDPEGGTVAEGNTPNGSAGPETLFAVAAMAGEHELEILALIPGAGAGTYELRLAPPRPATAEDEHRFQVRQAAWRAMEDGLTLRRSARDDEALQKAIERLAEAAPLWAELGDLDQQARVLNSMGVAHRQLGETRRARQLYEEALPLWRRAGNRQGEADQLYNLGRLESALGDARGALASHELALAIRRQIGDRRGVAESLAQVGAAHLALGDTEAALAAQREAVAASRSLGNRRLEAAALNNLGQVHLATHELQDALDVLREALELWRERDDLRGESITLSNLGTVYEAVGEVAEARRLYTRTGEIARRLGDPNGEAFAHFHIGHTYQREGRPEKARGAFSLALELWRKVDNRRGEGRALNALGDAYGTLDRPREGLGLLRQALAVMEEIGDRRGEVDARVTLGRLHRMLGEPEPALKQLRRALAGARELRQLAAEAAALTEMGRLEQERGHLEVARDHLEEAVERTETARARVLSEELRASYLASRFDRYAALIDVLMELDRRAPGRGHAGEAFAVSERARARSLLETLHEAAAGIRGGVKPALLDRERQLQQRINARERRRLELLDSLADEDAAGGDAPDGDAAAREAAAAEAAALAGEIDELLSELRELRAKIRTTSPRYAELTQPQPASAAEVQGLLRGGDTLLLELALGERRSYLWAVSGEGLTAHELPPAAEIEALARELYMMLRAPEDGGAPGAGEEADRQASLRRHAAALSQRVLGPVASRLHGQRLLIVADGALQLIPFAALPVPGADATAGATAPLLIERHEVLHLPSASTLAVLRREIGSRPPAPHTLAVLADPVFSSRDPRVKAPDIAGSGGGAGPRGAGEGSALTSFYRLRFSANEARAIADLAAADEPLLALGFEASRQLATGGELADYRLIHFATHAVLDSARPALSGIVLSLVDEAGEPQEGFLRLHDVYNLDLRADLVTLSACQTALGREVRGEGLQGLARGFIYAGASRVLASLWRVPDRASAEIMKRFYTALLVDGLPPAAALRSAQRSMLGEKRWRDPFQWAAFTLQGDWRSAPPLPHHDG